MVGVVIETGDLTTSAINALVAREAVVGWGVKLGGSTGQEVASAAPCVSGKETEAVDGMTFVRICAGTFTMGSAANDQQAWYDEKPAHPVTLSEFWIGRTEVTNEQYRRVRPEHQGDAELPAAGVTWTEAKAACEHFGGRLPTEAEWEYAARAGSQTVWSFGDDEKKLGENAWFGEGFGSASHPVAAKRPNAWGLHDMHGNAWEWVGDWYGPYTSAAQKDPTGPEKGDERVRRGGSFAVTPGDLRSAYRDGDPPEFRYRYIGFRCVRSARRQP